MSSKTTKVAKNKHGVRVMGLKKDSSTTSSVPVSTALVEHQETLNVQPLLHEPPQAVQPDLPKKKFKSKPRSSSRLRNSMKGKGSASSTTPIEILDEDDVIVDEVITKVVDDILEEAATKVMGPDVIPEPATSGDLKNPNSTNNVDTSDGKPIVDHPESEEEESESDVKEYEKEDSENEEEE